MYSSSLLFNLFRFKIINKILVNKICMFLLQTITFKSYVYKQLLLLLTKTK